MGHTPQVLPPGNLDFGSAQLAACLPGDEVAYAAGSDGRRDGMAVGY